MEKMTQRSETIDIAKAIAIWMVVTAHLIRKGPVTDYLQAVAVAMFFFCSGMTYHYHKDQRAYWKRLAWRVVLPYLGVGLFSILAYRILGQYAAQSLNAKMQETTLLEDALHLLYGSSLHGAMKWNESLWFLPCYVCVLLLANMYSSFMSLVQRNGQNGTTVSNAQKEEKYTRDPATPLNGASLVGLILAVFFAFGVSIYLTRIQEEDSLISLPWQFETACLMLPLFLLGHLIHRSRNGSVQNVDKTPAQDLKTVSQSRLQQRAVSNLMLRNGFVCTILAAVMLYVSLCLYQLLPDSISIRTNELKPWYLAYAFLFAGIAMLWFGSSALKALLHAWPSCEGILLTVGRNTLQILLWNKFAVLACQIFLPKLIPGITSYFVETTSLVGLCLAAILAVPCLAACLLWTKCLRMVTKTHHC